MRFNNFSFAVLTICYCIGICIAYIGSSTLKTPLWNIILLLILSICTTVILRKKQSILFTISCCIVFTLLGFLNLQLRTPSKQPLHFNKYIKPNSQQVVQLKIKAINNPNAYYDTYTAEIKQIENQTTTGSVHLQISNRNNPKKLEIDDILVLHKKPIAIEKEKNPTSFDFGSYLKSKGIYYTLKLNNTEEAYIKKGKPTLSGIAKKIQSELVSTSKNMKLSPNENAIFCAILLGDRSFISEKQYQEYVQAGAIHLLAISGLHVGIIAFLIGILCYPLQKLKYGSVIYKFTIVILLFAYALITGWTASVVRATVMFSLLSFAILSQRKTNTFNTLLLSLFLLLIIQPFWLFQTGFQLSYMAVFFILLLLPLRKKIWNPNAKLLCYIRDLVWVSVSAQLGVLPLSIFYFKKFSIVFLITNIAIVPTLGLVLSIGILLLLLNVLNISVGFLESSYNGLLKVINGFISKVSMLPGAAFETTQLSVTDVFILYGCSFLLIVFLYKTTAKHFLLVSLSCCIGIHLHHFSTIKKKQPRLIWHHNYKHSKLTLHTTDSIIYYGTNSLQEIKPKKIPSMFSFDNKVYFVLDSLGIIPPQINPDVLVLTQSPKIHLERVLDTLKPKLVLMDGSNYSSFVNRWKHTCTQKNIPHYDTATKGAFLVY